MDYEKILKGIVQIINTTEKSDIGFTNICTYIGDNCPELVESEDERIRKALVRFHKSTIDIDGIKGEEILAWLEKREDKPKKVSIWKHWKDGIAGNAEGEQVFLQKIGRNYCISSCLGCECDYIELSELDKFMREEKQGKLKWNKDDEKNLNDLDVILFEYKDIPKENYWHIINWLKSIKQRMEE